MKRRSLVVIGEKKTMLDAGREGEDSTESGIGELEPAFVRFLSPIQNNL